MKMPYEYATLGIASSSHHVALRSLPIEKAAFSYLASIIAVATSQHEKADMPFLGGKGGSDLQSLLAKPKKIAVLESGCSSWP